MLQPAEDGKRSGKTERCHANGERNFLLKSEMREARNMPTIMQSLYIIMQFLCN